ncbi:peptidase inhibitor family I36 protein [Microbacterium suaedae]|uniref:peptidase inhibitor family I36 protein n=1 Tax=Microbacterium suaedae TaxID=2067813 RepID=UPI000DA26350|nr:peptidase inhibitor family I36 protein [Microbacterium suaedae]
MTVAKRKVRSGRLLPAVIGLVVALAAPLVAVVPANAAASDCSSGYTCIWRDHTYRTNGSGTSRVQFQQYIPDYSTLNYSGTTINAGNNAVSVYNNGNTDRVRIYDRANKGGSYFQLAIKTGDGNISNSAGYIQGISWRPNSGYFSTFW